MLIHEAILGADDRLQEIGVTLLHPGENTVLSADWLRRTFTRASNEKLIEVYRYFFSMQTSLNAVKRPVSVCINQYKDRAFGGQLNEIIGNIRYVIQLDPNSIGNMRKTTRNFERRIVEPLRKLPEIDDPAAIALMRCLNIEYSSYKRNRSKNHKRIKRIADKLPLLVLRNFF